MEALIVAGLAGLAGKVAYEMVGPLAKEVGKMLVEEVEPYRAPRRKALIDKSVRMIRDVDVRARAIPGRILFPILDYASLEDDPDLQTMWASLFANAACSPAKESIPVIFAETLRQLSYEDAVYLRALRSVAEGRVVKDVPPDVQRFQILQAHLGLTRDLYELFVNTLPFEERNAQDENPTRFDICIGNILRLNLIRPSREVTQLPERLRPRYGGGLQVADYFYFTGLGVEFLRACEPPKKQ